MQEEFAPAPPLRPAVRWVKPTGLDRNGAAARPDNGLPVPVIHRGPLRMQPVVPRSSVND